MTGTRQVTWTDRAACRTSPTPDDWYATTQREVVRAVRACRGCPVLAACREAGEGERFGVWGGVPRDPAQQAVLEQVRAVQRRADARQRAKVEADLELAARRREEGRVAARVRRAAESPERRRERLDRQAAYNRAARARARAEQDGTAREGTGDGVRADLEATG